MKENKIKVELELTPEQIENIKIELDLDQVEELEDQVKELEKKMGIYDIEKYFGRAEVGEPYYYISNKGSISIYEEAHDGVDDEIYNVANYCTDKDLIQQQAYRETLNRLLWRFSMENGGDKVDWNKGSIKYYIYKDHYVQEYYIGLATSSHISNVVFFISEEIARRAIDEIIKPFMKEHPDFEF